MKKTIYIAVGTFLSLSLLLTGCGGKEAAETSTNVKAGTYTATEEGKEGDVTVTVEVDDTGKIINLKIDAPNETEGVGSEAVSLLQSEILENQTVKVDTVSGATGTSTAVLNATANAMKEAGVDTDSMEDLTTGK